MADETILLKIEVDNGDLVKKLEDNKSAIVSLKQEQANLNKAFKEGSISQKEYVSESVRVEQLTKAHTKAYSDLSHQLQGTKSFTDQLKWAFQQNSTVIDKMTGGLASTTQGIGAMTKHGLAFIATPLGAVIAAIVVALGSLTAYLKNTGSGSDALAEKTAILRFAFEKLMRGVEAVGKVVFQSIEFIAGAAEKLIAFISPAAGQAIEEAKKAGEAIARLDDEIDERETELIKRRADVNLQVAQLREEAIRQEGKQREATIQKAIDLERGLAEEEVKLRQMKLDLFLKEHQTKTDLTDEEKRQQAELAAAVVDAEAQKYEATLRFQKEIEKLKEETDKKEATRRQIELERREADKLWEQEQELRKIEENAKAEEELAKEIEKTAKKIEDEQAFFDRIVQMAIDANNKETESDKKQVEAEFQAEDKKQKKKKETTQLEFLLSQQKLSNLSTVLSQVSGIIDKESSAYKALAIAQAMIDTYRAATAALAPPPVGAGPLFGPLLAATTIGLGLANVAKIAGFAEGGFTGPGAKHEVAGVVHRGEYVVPAHLVSNPAYSGHISQLESARRRGYQDGGLVTNMATTGQDQNFAKMLEKMQIFVSWTEGQNMGNSIKWKERLAEI